MNLALARFMITLLILSGCSGRPPENFGIGNGSLAPCPDSPNCVSTKSRNPKSAMTPLPFIGTKDQTRNRIIQIIGAMERSEIIKATDSYVYVQYKTRFLQFVDDVEFLFDDTAEVVHFRSASRVGYYDFGMNRRRMIEVSKAYLNK
jgi:uncharacterized protein (DUF1499 family)